LKKKKNGLFALNPFFQNGFCHKKQLMPTIRRITIFKEAFAVRIWLTQERYLNASLERHSTFIQLAQAYI
jgi:hypothetical protein